MSTVAPPVQEPTNSGISPRVELNTAPVKKPLTRFFCRSVKPVSSSSKPRLSRPAFTQNKKPGKLGVLAVPADVDHLSECFATLLMYALNIIFLERFAAGTRPLTIPTSAPNSPTGQSSLQAMKEVPTVKGSFSPKLCPPNASSVTYSTCFGFPDPVCVFSLVPGQVCLLSELLYICSA